MRKTKNPRRFLALLIASVIMTWGVAVATAQAKETIRLGRATALFMAPDDLLMDLFDQYEAQNPNVEIKYEPTPFNDYFQKMGLSLSAGNAPDIFILNEIWRYVENDFLAPAPLEYAQDVTRNFGVAAVPPTYQGEVYGYPLEGGLRLTVYNKTMFEEAGIKVQPGEHFPARDWEEYLDFALKTTKRSGDRIIQEGFKVPADTSGNTVCSLASFFWSAGGEFYSYEQNRVCLDQPATYKALGFWNEMVKTHKVSDATYELDTFAQNRCAMFIAGQYYLGHLETDAPFIDYGVFFTPAPREEAGEGTMPGTPAYDNGPWMYVVNEDSKVKEECWKFLRWLTSDEVSVEIAKEGACIFRDSAIEIAKTELDEVLRTFLEAQKYVHPRTPKYWRFLVTRFPPQIQSLLLGQKSILDAVTTAEEQINEDIRTGKGKL